MVRNEWVLPERPDLEQLPRSVSKSLSFNTDTVEPALVDLPAEHPGVAERVVQPSCSQRAAECIPVITVVTHHELFDRCLFGHVNSVQVKVGAVGLRRRVFTNPQAS